MVAYKGKRSRRGVGALNTMANIQSMITGAVAAAAAKKMFKRKAGSATRTVRPTQTRYRKKSVNKGTTSVTMTKRKKTVRENHSTENTSTWLNVPAKKPSPMKLINAILEPQWYRVQAISQYDTSTGFITLANRSENNTTHVLPVHVWDITSLPNYDTANIIYPDAGFGLVKTSTAGNADCLAYPLNSESADGTIRKTNTQWITENATGGFDDLAKRKAFHHWTHIKCNLYGCRKRATKFTCQLIMVKDEYADFINGGQTNREKHKLFDYLARPYIYNNLNSGDPQTADDIKILKTYEVTVAPISTDQYGGADAVPQIQTLNWFINHNRMRRYDWRRDIPPPSTQEPNFDAESGSGHNVRVDPSYRVYFVMRALSPEKRNVSGSTNDFGPDPISEPSYDIVLRNKFSVPT